MNLKSGRTGWGGLIVIGLFLAGCGSSGDIVEDSSYFTPQNPPPAAYKLKARCRVEEKAVHLDGEGEILFTNSGKRPISTVALEWPFKTADLEVSIGMRHVPQRQSKPVHAGVSFFSLPRAFRPNENVKLAIRFTQKTTVSDIDDIAFQRWYPKLWWDGLPTRDAFSVEFEAPDGYVTASSGRLDPKTGTYENAGVTTGFGLRIFKDIQIEERETGGVRIRSFYTEEGRECALLCLETAVDAVGFYKDLHGFFPFESLTIVPGASRPMGGYPFASALVVIHGQQAFKQRPELFWKWITAHEIGHQYWGEYIMSRDEPGDYTESWMMIGMGIFADRMYTESRGLGDERHESFFKRFLEGLENYYDTTADAPESLKALQRFDRNNVLIHGKGYSIVSALRSALGDDVFKRVYLRCVDEYGGKRLSYRDFQKIAEEESGESLYWFFHQWVRSPGYLSYRISSTDCRPVNGGYRTEISVKAQGETMAMPVDVEAVFKDGSSQTARVERWARDNKLVFQSQAEFDRAVLDPLGRLAMLDAPLPIRPKEIPDRVRRLAYLGSWDKGIALFEIAKESDCRDYRIWSKLGMVVFEGGYFEEAFTCFEKVLNGEAPESSRFMAATWLGNVRDAQGRRKEAVDLYRKALSMAPEGDGWRHDQFGITSSQEWIIRRLEAPYDWSGIIKRVKNS